MSFGPFRLIPSQRVLFENGSPRRLGSRALEILCALIERAGQLVTKEELLARAWPDTVVGEANLRVHVRTLRRVLGDGTAGRRYLVTAPGRGYAFVEPVRRTQEAITRRPPSSGAPLPLETVLSLATAFCGELQRSVLLPEILRVVLARSPASRAAFVGVDEHGAYQREAVITRDLRAASSPTSELPWHLCARVVRGRKTLTDDGSFGLPLVARGNVLGVLLVDGELTPRHLDVLEVIAAQASVALEAARQHELQRDRTDVVRGLASSIAQNVSQPLAGVATNASTCLRWLERHPPDVEEAREAARRTVRDGQRAAGILTELRARIPAVSRR